MHFQYFSGLLLLLLLVQFAISSIFGMNFQVLIFCIEVDIFLVSSDKISFMENIFSPFLYQRKNYRKWNILSLTSMQNLFIRFFLSPMWFVKVVVCFYRYIKLLFSYNGTFTHFLYIIVNTCWKKYLNVFIICIFGFLRFATLSHTLWKFISKHQIFHC